MPWADLKAAKIERVVDGKVIDLHSLRVTFITPLQLAGLPLTVAQKLARHCVPRLTANAYTQLGLSELQRAVESLSALSAVPPAGPRRAEAETPG